MKKRMRRHLPRLSPPFLLLPGLPILVLAACSGQPAVPQADIQARHNPNVTVAHDAGPAR